ncbi:MAG: RHS repeat-associated core domain-containing protein [Chitinophagales bacterium]
MTSTQTINSFCPPFGMVMPGRNWTAGTAEGYGFGFNGKENDDDVKGDDNSLDFGARIYDPRLGKWLSLDPLQNKYPFVSAYAFAINSPIQALDPDGRLVIFINGLSNFLACCPGEKGYWGSWADAAMNKIQDHNAMYIDGENIWLSTVEERTAQGYRIGQEKAKDVIDNLAKDSNGKIIESVKIITHSMGAATERGFSNALIDYVDSYNLSVEEHNKTEDQLAALAKSRGETYIPQYQQKIEGFKIEFVVDISAYQSKELIADFNAEDRYYMRNTDGFNANTWPIQGAQEIGVDNNGVPKADDHGLGAFDASDVPTDKDGIDTTKMTEYGNEAN